MNLGVYISTRNDENLIEDCIRPIKKFFPQVVVIDVGSEDNTIKNAKNLGVKIHDLGEISKIDYTILKQEYCNRHDWAFWVDSDEIYPEGSLIKIKNRLKDPNYPYSTINVLWKILKVKNGKLYETEETKDLCACGRLFNPNHHYYTRAWPKEVHECINHSRKRCSKEPKGLNGIFCWHCVLLNRSSSIVEITGRRKKRLEKIKIYEKYTWKEIPVLPWKNSTPEALKEI
jgi:glycosyltransferase involved in cell wall biosynthesis